MLKDLTALLRHRIARTLEGGLAAQGAKNVRVAKVSVEVEARSDTGFTIRATYFLAAEAAPGDHPLVVLGPLVDTKIEGVECAIAGGSITNAAASQGALLLALQPGMEWDGGQITATYVWRPIPGHGVSRAGPRCLVIPQHLHRVRSPQAKNDQLVPRRQPVMALSLTGLEDRIGCWSIPADAAAPSGSDPTMALQAVLLPQAAQHPALRPAERPLVTVSSSLTTRLPAADCRALAAELAGALAFIGSWLGTGVTAPAVLVDFGDLLGSKLFPEGAAISGIRSDAWNSPRAVRASQPELGGWAAALWWGVGCQLVGPSARELMSGIRSALCLTWLEVWDQAEFRRTLKAHQTSVRRLPVLSQWQSLRAALRGFSRPAQRDRIALTLFDAFKQDAALRSWFAAYTQEHWGYLIPVAAFSRGLAERGITLP